MCILCEKKSSIHELIGLEELNCFNCTMLTNIPSI